MWHFLYKALFPFSSLVVIKTESGVSDALRMEDTILNVFCVNGERLDQFSIRESSALPNVTLLALSDTTMKVRISSTGKLCYLLLNEPPTKRLCGRRSTGSI
jgi:hypothetical protein